MEENYGNEISKSKLRLVTPASQVGSELTERYQVVGLIGSGATSSVFEGYDNQSDRKVAIKALHAHLVDKQDVVERFEREARTAAAIAHPNVVRIFDQTKTEFSQPLLIMEFVGGIRLQELMISCGGSLPVERAVNIFLQIAAALAVAHEKGIVHRDLKPQNIMVDASNQDHVKVLDFGIAKTLSPQGDTHFKLTQSGETLGSLLYMSPEQCLDEDVDERSDIYSLGCLMYEVLMGKPPLSGRTAFETMNAQITQTPSAFKTVRPERQISTTLETTIFKAMEKRPDNRFQSVNDLIEELREAKFHPDDPVEPKCEVTELAKVETKLVPRSQNTPLENQALPSLNFSEELNTTIRLERESVAVLNPIVWCSGIMSIVSTVCFFGAFCGLYPAGREFVCATVNGLLLILSLAVFFSFEFLTRTQSVRVDALERSIRRIGALDAISELPKVSTNGKTPFDVEFSMKHKRGHEVLYRGKIMPLTKPSEKIWQHVAASSGFGLNTKEFQTPSPLGIIVFFDEASNKPIACSTQGAFAIVVSSSAPEVQDPKYL